LAVLTKQSIASFHPRVSYNLLFYHTKIFSQKNGYNYNHWLLFGRSNALSFERFLSWINNLILFYGSPNQLTPKIGD